MAGIKSLSVRGIRSFGAEDSDEQRITFDKPLTLILGQNGCGKTTIIECMRYAVSGQMPPGSRNECFVHDAKINRSNEVLAQVKLKMVNAKDKQLEITRSMRVTAIQKKKSKFQTLDSCLSLIDENGVVKDISSRCADLDFMVQEELGVSKAIISSVIFCHQEDSSWPLDEGKKVKERFDEIFDADKYSDCFDRLRKIRKEYATNIKILSTQVSFLSEQKAELDKKKLRVVNTESDISEKELKVAELSNELKPVSEKLHAIEELQKNLVAFQTKRDKIKTRLEHCKKQEEQLTSAIQKLFEGNTEELQENITNYESLAKTKKKEMDDARKKIIELNKEEEKIANTISSNEVKYNKLMLLEQQNQERIDKKNFMILTTAQLAELEITDVETAEDAEKTINEISEKLKTLQEELNQLKASADVEENKLQAKMNESLEARSTHRQKIVGKKQEIAQNKKETLKTQRAIDDAKESKEKLEAVEEKYKEAEVEYDTIAASMNVDECQKEINEDEKMMEKHETEIEEISEKINKLQNQNAKLKEKEMKEENLRSKEKQLGVLKNKHKANLTELLGRMPEKDFNVTLNKFECEVRGEVDSIKKKLKAAQIELTKQESERKHIREMLNERKTELTAAEDKMYKACGTQTYDATLSKLSATVKKLQEEQNLLQSSLFIMGKYKEQLKENNCCPLCNRGFDAEAEVSDLISDLTTKVMNVPAKLEKATEELQKATSQKEDLLSLKTLNEKIESLKEKDIPALETRLADADKKIEEINKSIEEMTESVKQPEQKMQTAKQMQGDMPLLDRYIKEIDAATKEFDKISAQCVNFITDMTVEQATTTLSDLRVKLSTLRMRVKTARNKLNAHNKKLNTARDNKNKLHEQMLQIQKKVQELVTLQEKLSQLESSSEQFKKELDELEAASAAFDDEVKDRENEKKALITKNRGEIDVKRSFIMNVENSFEKVKTVQKEIKKHEERNVPQEMEKIKESNEKLAEKKVTTIAARDENTKKVDELKDELAKSSIYKRDLEDNLRLRKSRTEAEQCETEIAEVEASLAGLNLDSIAEKESLIVKQTALFREKAETDGSLKQLKKNLEQAKLDLQRAQNQDIERRYRDKFHDLEVTKALDRDIRDYAMALEKCLMEFHKEKMENINLIIREMWRKIYRGNDIDYIEIKTEGSMTTDSDRRKYDYRVVQCKNGVEIDMRGRCSAGQKVLACLIIRLALAETFSARFGILALDEPTTNLDQENVRSLCSALGEIVQERMRQKNFMFIIITHDKEFIESLGNIDKVTHYYEVSRNDEGKSRIKKIRFT